MSGFTMVSWQTALYDLLRIAFAYVLALPIGWDREQAERSAGVRTFPIVSIAACGFMMIATSIPNASADSYSRVLQGLIVGIGFVGGGAILRDKEKAHGVATAASIWNIGIVGAAVGLGLYHIAAILTLINWLTLKFLTPIKRQLDSRSED
jgi:putative Mg2+ transporter-C (MgtC) family protein